MSLPKQHKFNTRDERKENSDGTLGFHEHRRQARLSRPVEQPVHFAPPGIDKRGSLGWLDKHTAPVRYATPHPSPVAFHKMVKAEPKALSTAMERHVIKSTVEGRDRLKWQHRPDFN